MIFISAGGGAVAQTPPACAGCAKLNAQHLAWIGFFIAGPSNRAFFQAVLNNHNDYAAITRSIQTLHQVCTLQTNGVPQWTSADYMINHDTPVWNEFDYELTGHASTSFTCKYYNTNDPAFTTFQNGAQACVKGWGIATLVNSQMSVHAGFIVRYSSMTAPGEDGSGTLVFHSETPVVGNLIMSRLNAGNPVVLRVRVFNVPEQWATAQHVTPLWASPATLHINNLAQAQPFPVASNTRLVPLGSPWTKVSIKKAGVFTDLPVGFIHVPNGSGGYDVFLDQSGIDVTGATEIKVECWQENPPNIPEPTTTVYENDTPTAGTFTIATGLQYQGGGYFEVYAEDEWHGISPTNMPFNISDGIGWFNTRWTIDAADLMWQPPTPPDDPPPDPLPENWEPTHYPTPDPVPITKIKASFPTRPWYFDDMIPVTSDRCVWSQPDYTSFGGIQEGSCKFFCAMRNDEDLTDYDREHYQARCYNQKCRRFAVNMIRDTLNAPFPSYDSFPFEQEQAMVGDPQTIMRRVGAQSLMSLTGTFWDEATGTRFTTKRQNAGTGGWGARGTELYWAYNQEIQVGDVDEETGDPILDPETGQQTFHTELVPVYFSRVILRGGIKAVASRWPLTEAQIGYHHYSKARTGRFGKKRRYRSVDLHFPMIKNDTNETQVFHDGKATKGVYFGGDWILKVELANGVQPFKDLSKEHTPEVVTSVKALHVDAVEGGGFKFVCEHKTATYTRPGGTGEEDVEVGIKCGGTTVLLPEGEEPTNHATAEAIMFSMADSGYVSNGCALKVPTDPRVPAEYQGLLIPIDNCVSCDDTEAIPASWTLEQLKFLNVMGAPDLDKIKYPDTFTVADEDGILEDISSVVDLEELTFDVTYSSFCQPGTTAALVSSGRTATDTAIADAKVFTASGVFYLKTIPQCLKISCDLVEFADYPSAANDLNPIIDTSVRMFSM